MTEKLMTYSEFLSVQRQLDGVQQMIGVAGNRLRDKLKDDRNGILSLLEFETAIIRREQLKQQLTTTDVVVSTNDN